MASDDYMTIELLIAGESARCRVPLVLLYYPDL